LSVHKAEFQRIILARLLMHFFKEALCFSTLI